MKIQDIPAIHKCYKQLDSLSKFRAGMEDMTNSDGLVELRYRDNVIKLDKTALIPLINLQMNILIRTLKDSGFSDE